MEFTDKKIVASGSTIEVSKFDGGMHPYDFHIPKRPKYKLPIPIDETEEQKVFRLELERKTKLDSRRRSMLNSKLNLTRLINCNIWKYIKDDGKPYIPIFLTLTFKEDVRDIPSANYIFNKFLKRLNYEVIGEKKGFLKYVAVMEHQDKTRAGVIHYHVVFFNLKFIWADTIASIWDEGFIKIKKIGNVKNIARYLTKYMSKNFEDDRMDGKKRYFSSHWLLKPKIFYEQKKVDEIYNLLQKKYLVNEREYTSRRGYEEVKAEEYRLPKNVGVDDLLGIDEFGYPL
jgi:hypothetical protein